MAETTLVAALHLATHSVDIEVGMRQGALSCFAEVVATTPHVKCLGKKDKR